MHDALRVPQAVVLAVRCCAPCLAQAADQNLCCVQGYGTVRFTTKEDAEKAIADFHGTDLEGRALAVKIDKYAPAHPYLAHPL